MTSSHSHGHHHDATHGHAHSTHSHGPALPHPSQAVSWSILRMTALARLAAAAGVATALWAIVWLAMK